MTPRELAEKRELELLVDYLARRNFQNAGDGAELKAALAASQAETEAQRLRADEAEAKLTPAPAAEDPLGR